MAVRETIVVFDRDGRAIYWHEPDDRSAGYVPDSDDLFNFLWANKHRLGGYAHTHPWNGSAQPSGTDLSTYAALEKGLGMRLLWPVVSFTEVMVVFWDTCVSTKSGKREGYFTVGPDYHGLEFDWIDELRRKSGSEETPPP